MVCSRRIPYFDRHIERITVFALISLALLSFIGSTIGQKLTEEEPVVEGSGFSPDDEDYGVEGSGVPPHDEPHPIYGSHNNDDTTSTSSSTAATMSTTSSAAGRPFMTTRKPAQKPSHNASSFSTYLPTPLALVIGLIALLLLVVFVTTCYCCCCRKKRRRSNSYTRGTATSKTYV